MTDCDTTKDGCSHQSGLPRSAVRENWYYLVFFCGVAQVSQPREQQLVECATTSRRRCGLPVALWCVHVLAVDVHMFLSARVRRVAGNQLLAVGSKTDCRTDSHLRQHWSEQQQQRTVIMCRINAVSETIAAMEKGMIDGVCFWLMSMQLGVARWRFSHTTWLTTAQDGFKLDSMESDCVSSRLKQPKRTTTPEATTTPTEPDSNRTSNTHD